MPDIHVNTKVGVGAIGSVTNGTSIGTDGLTFCVGVIAVDGSNTTCAHFSCGFGGASTPEKVQQIMDETTRILTDAHLETGSKWGYANHSNDWTSDAIVNACLNYFITDPNPASRTAETISINAAGDIEVSFDNVVGEVTVENTGAEVNPPA